MPTVANPKIKAARSSLAESTASKTSSVRRRNRNKFLLQLIGGALSFSSATSSSSSAAAANYTARRSIIDSTAFIPPPSNNNNNNKQQQIVRIEEGSTNNKSMKRAPSPPVAFTSSIKRSFGISSSTSSTSLNMSTSVQHKSDTHTPNNNNNNSSSSSKPPMYNFYNSLSPSWINQLSSEDPTNYEKSLTYGGGSARSRGSSASRPVFNGHYVLVRPTPLKNPRLVIASPEMLAELGFSNGEEESESFIKYFSGDVDNALSDIDFFLATTTTTTDNVDEDDAGMQVEKSMESGLERRREIETWATPYALSIMGKRYTNNCPYGTGDGYGDGRAISVGEILVPHSSFSDEDTKKKNEGERKAADQEISSSDEHPLEKQYPKSASRYELQLKGAGQTPFCRGADGRAVLRSSIREFLASEAMHHLGISTTRALSLIVSESPNGDTSNRPWYSENTKSRDLPSMDDPRLSRYDMKQRKEIISQLAVQAKSDPDMLVEEKCAITTRVASSFVRIGHLDLFARRVEMLGMKSGSNKEAKIKETSQYQELVDMMWHACYREFHDTAYAPYYDTKDAKNAALALLNGSMTNIAKMIGGWIRVGFVQGNFNADNCLVGGRTMDYGPFGFLDVYHPLSAKWTGSGDHFGFMNQPNAGYANFAVLVESLMPIIDAEGGDVDEVRDEMLKKAQDVFSDAVDVAMRAKMGLECGGPTDMNKEADELWGEIEPLLRIARADWTLFWRQLTYVAQKYSPTKWGTEECDLSDYDGMLVMLLGDSDTNPFYDALSDENQATLRAWIEKWHNTLTKCYQSNAKTSKEVIPPEEIMRLANPKYTLKEWMLVEAYTKADAGKSPGNPFSVSGDYTGVHELFQLIKDPYSEGTPDNHKKYYRRAPEESLRAGGTAFMS